VQVNGKLRAKTVLSQTTSASSSYNILSSDYANLIAARDAQTKAVRVIAEDIRNRLGVYFTGVRRAGIDEWS
jgi:LPS-assembly lipoprotein